MPTPAQDAFRFRQLEDRQKNEEISDHFHQARMEDDSDLVRCGHGAWTVSGICRCGPTKRTMIAEGSPD